MSLGSIVVRLQMQTADFETDAGRAAKVAQRRAREIDSAFRSMGVAIGVALGGAAVVLRKYIQNTVEAEKVQAQLAARIKDTGGAAGRSLEQLSAQAEKLQSLTIFDDETIGGAQAMLMTFKGIEGLQFDRTIEASLDLATVMGTEAADAAKLLGKALADPEKGMSALSRAGVVFTEAEREAIKVMAEAGNMAKAQDAILDKLAGTMGSAAEAARNTLGGALAGLRNSFDNLLEGDTGSDGVRGTVDAINSLTGVLNDPATRQGMDNIAGGIANIVAQTVEGISALARLEQSLGMISGISDKRAAGVAKSAYSDKELQTTIALLSRGKSKATASGDAATAQRLQAEITALIRENTRRIKDGMATQGVDAAFDFLAAGLPKLPAPSAGGGRSSGGRASGGSARKASMPNFLSEDQDALRRMVEQTAAANEEFDRMAATLAGPLASAEYEHQQNMREITALGMEAERGTGEIVALKEAEAKRYQVQRKEIEATLDPMGQLLQSMQTEIDMIGLSNAERAMMNTLRERGIDLAGKEGVAYMDAARAMDAERATIERALGDQIALMDAFRDGATDALTDFVTGAKSAKDALGDFFDDMAGMITRMIAERWMEQLFGARGTNGSGTSGGGWLASLAGALSGGPGKSNGGYTGPGGVLQPAGIVHRGEVVWSQTDIARAGGVGAVEAMRRGRVGRGTTIHNTINVPRNTSYETAEQVASRAGMATTRSMRRNG